MLLNRMLRNDFDSRPDPVIFQWPRTDIHDVWLGGIVWTSQFVSDIQFHVCT